MVNEEEKPHVQPAAFTYLQQPRNPPNFSGKGSELAHLWLKDYSRVAAYNGWDESMCLANVVFFLEGAARCWFDNVEESITTWNTFKEEFARTFGDKEDYARRIESSLKVRAQKPDESVELYIQDVLNLCRQLNPNMSEEDRVGHLMKGVAENIYRALLAIEVTTTGEFTQHCRRIEKLNKNRISSVRFERIPTVSAINENEYHPLKEMIREIIREELRSAPNELDNLLPPQGLEDRVWQRVEQNLAPIDKQPVFHSGRAVKNFRSGQQNAGEARRAGKLGSTACKGGKVGHCLKPPQTRADLDDNYMWVSINGRHVEALIDTGASYSVVSSNFRKTMKAIMFESPNITLKVANNRFVAPLGKCRLRVEINGLQRIFEFLVLPNCSHDAILGWDFLESSKAVIDCGHSEISFSETLNEDQSAAQLHLASDDIIPPKFTKRVLTRTPSVTGIKNCAVEGVKQLFLEKELFVPSSYLTIWHGQTYLWVTNFSKHPKTIPSGMCLAHLFRVQPQEVCPIMENHSNNESKSAKSPIRITNFECREESVGSSEQLMRMEQISACISPELPLLHKTKLLELLENFSEVFSPIDKTTSRIITKHRINTGDAKPSKKMPYRVSPSERKVIQEEVDRMMEMGVVQPSESPWASPVVLVRKKDGSVRFCVDYRGLNKMTKKDVYPLPRVDDALDCLKEANIYSTIDLKAGYWQIGIDEADREKTAFITPDGLFEFKVMPFGLCNAPATFERMMDNLLKGLRWTICLCYLDDVVIFADNFPDHLRRLEVVLNCFKRAGLKLNPGKCSFGASNIKILGHQVNKDGIRPDDDKIKAVNQFPIPKNLQQLRSFLGLSSYYRRFIKNYADIARPLNSLLSKGTKFQWNTDQERAFQKLKNALTSKPVLGHFDDDAPTELHTDASVYGIGAVLAQKQGNGEKVIAYASRTLLKSEKNYSTTERECLAIVWAIGKFRPYLFGRPFKVITDHHSLCWLTNLKDPADLLGRFPISQGKKKWIVVCTDYLTKYAVTQSLGSGEAQEIAKFLLEEVILKHGAPREIVMDRGRNFQSRLIQELTKNCHIKKKTTTAYHPQTNGLTERLNRTIADMLSMYMDLDQKNWDEMLPFITFAYNTARQESTGFTPFFLVHGREAETTLDTIFPYSSASEGEEFIQLVASRAEEARQIARHHIFKAQETNKLNYDARHKGKIYQPGDLVWIFTPIRRVGLSEKLLRRYFGPYKVIKKISDVTYEVEAFGKSDKRQKGRDTVHILRMKPYYGPSRQEDSSIVLNPNIDIPKYDGTEDPRPWIESLEEIGFLYHWADYIISRYAAMNMTGSAKTWLNLHKASFTSWENIKIRLIQDFSLDANKEELRMKLNRMQHWNEPAIRFAEDILVLCNKVDPAMEEETKIEHVIGGLKKEYSFALYLNPPKTTDDLLVIFRVGRFKLSVAPESVNQSKSTINGIKKLDPKYKLKINVDKIGTFEALVDTGADLSVVDLRTALDTGHGISKLAKICAGPDGKKLDMVGSIFLNIKIDDETLSHNFVILKTHLRTLILGRDFLKKMNAKIDCKQETIKYDLTNNHDEINFEMLKIKSAKDSIVPECSMKLIKALVETEDGEYIIEESSKMFQTNGLRLARSLINVINRETHIWITNPYPRPLKIMKNQTLAFGSSPAKINVSREREVEKNEEPRFQINENLSPKEQKELKQVLERYGDLFSSRLGRTNLAKHRIDTEDAKPIKHKPYRVSAKERDIIKEQIDEMLTEGIIRPSSSPWSFPVILVKKRDGKYRFCVDYRKLNNVTVKDVYPIPRIDEVMDTLQGSTHFSAIDLRSGYWQVEVEERDKEKTAFTTAHGLYEFNVMPFGLCNAPATFERNMENMLGNLRWQICLCYLDDVIIYSPDFPTHLKRLEAVFRCFRESNLRLNDKKCRFAFEELEILGYITSKHGIKPAEHNIKAVRNFPRPKKVKEVQSFLGMCSYYRKFIKDFSKIADPLTNLIKKSVSFTWTERQEEAFQTLKTALLSPPILGHFNPNAPTYVHTDASNIGIGATLVQDIGGEEKVISYLSRTLSKAEQNYSTTEKECLAVVWSMSKLRPYLYGRHFKIPIPPANFPFERIGIDFVGPLPSTKNRKKWIIVLSDYYTRYAETRAVSEATVKEVSKFLVEDIFLRHGAPQYLISDRGSQFTSNLMKEVMKTCKIKHCFTTSYHPQTNGLTERLNRTLINMLSMYVNTDQKNWDEILPFITHAYNTTIQETTGYSPFFLMFGREPTSLLDDRNISVDIDKDDYDEYIKHHLDKINRTRKLVINNTIKTQERMKKNYDKKHIERSYEPGELVAVWTPIRKIGKCEKLLRKYFGPYRILKKLSNVNYLIEPKDNPGQDPLIVHVSRIKPYFERIDEVNHEDFMLLDECSVACWLEAVVVVERWVVRTHRRQDPEAKTREEKDRGGKIEGPRTTPRTTGVEATSMKTIKVRPDGKRKVLRRASSDEDLSSSVSPIFITAKLCFFDQIESKFRLEWKWGFTEDNAKRMERGEQSDAGVHHHATHSRRTSWHNSWNI
ncbi:hypothetical protein LAZ67_13000337 [Cordylochernes scorpioides]|uniref:Endonuclease n=1 Tax=Cordylochernes scorpioides TaxID=51811 RepID=A0ABY6L3A3_9ARAC|nr:hypothetical protein LAZ67_13000337 [Cordylochernes scorpioides]